MLLRDPRIVAAFFLAHPVNKVASFSKPERRKDSLDKLGYLSAWESEEVCRELEEQASLRASPQNFVGSPPSSNDLPVVKPRPARVVKK